MQNSLSAHLDGTLSGEERQRLVMHLTNCGDCDSRLAQMARVRAALNGLPARTAPPRLTTALRVIASKERTRVLAGTRPFAQTVDRFRLWVDNLMRPLALPFAGGLISAMLLFSMLVPTFAFRRAPGNDVPVGLMTGPTIKAQMPFDDFACDGDCVVSVIVDDQGRMVDYDFPKGSAVATNPAVRRAIERNLLFTEFTPATMFGQPTFGKLYVSYQKRQIDIKS